MAVIGSQFQNKSYIGNPAKLTAHMNGWVLGAIWFAGVIVVFVIGIFVVWLRSRDEQADEENPSCLDQPREARESQSRGLWIEFFLLSLALLALDG